ncbi:DUF3164 family protein [Elizabethkingia phage TCUEAP3]|nr:DUF3164 family protein [Elizabethkingia phage TCUEAP3]
MKTIDLKSVSAEELEAALAEKKETERLAREKQRTDYEALKKETIDELAPIAEDLHLQLSRFKGKAFSQIGALYELLQVYSKRHQDGKGNFEISNEDYKIQFKRQGKGTFDERSHQAEQHIIDFINNRFGGDADTRDFIMLCLERKKGALDVDQVQKLYSMEDRFNDENWKEGIKLLKESYSFIHSKDYVTVSKKDRNGAWKPLVLNFSSL